MTTTSSPGSKPVRSLHAARMLRLTGAAKSGFTLLEMMVVIAIIAIALGLLVPALGIGSGRAVEGSARQFVSDLENARAIAVTERTRTRILLPETPGDFANATVSPTPWPSEINLRGYVIASSDRTATVWKQRGKWTRLPDGVAFDPSAVVFNAPATPGSTPIVVSPTGNSASTYEYSGPHIEFLANGSSSLDPAATPTTAAVADGFVNPNGSFNPKNRKLRYSVAIDPLSGSVSLQ